MNLKVRVTDGLSAVPGNALRTRADERATIAHAEKVRIAGKCTPVQAQGSRLVLLSEDVEAHMEKP